MDSAAILLARQTYAQTNEFNNVIPATARDTAMKSYRNLQSMVKLDFQESGSTE
jgi:hypothetical protein